LTEFRFSSGLGGPIRLTQQLPVIVKGFSIDGNSRLTPGGTTATGTGKVVVDGSQISLTAGNTPVQSGDSINGFEFRGAGAAGSVLAPELEPGEPVHPGVAEGVLIGGNLSLVAALTGTPWAWNPHGAILFLEDVSESLYRVDRCLTQLQLAGVLQAVAGIVLGSFTESEAPEALLRERLLPLCRERGKPLLGGWPTGHGTPNRPLPMGLHVRLDASAGTLTMLEDLIV
jgi:muramoyltetrapeptide carboxypeptidase LdcA involved in peptidoglycan recycling